MPPPSSATSGEGAGAATSGVKTKLPSVEDLLGEAAGATEESAQPAATGSSTRENSGEGNFLLEEE